MEKGKLIVVEGACDGVGKSTQYSLLSKRLESEGKIVTYHHFPSYGTYHGAPVERYLMGEFGQPNELSPELINTLYAADRMVVWNTILKKPYEEGGFILLDRYTTSSLIYQASVIEDLDERKRFIDYVINFEYNIFGVKEPDGVIFLHAPFDLVTRMRNARKENDGIVNDIHESNLEYMKKVYDNAMFVAEYLGFDMVQCNRGDEMRTIDDIHEEVYRLVKRR